MGPSNDSGSKMQPEFNRNVSRSQVVNYVTPATGGFIQDLLRAKNDAEMAADFTVSPPEPSADEPWEQEEPAKSRSGSPSKQ
ncbi:Hypothetical protein LUCI_3468 [Lucifera butyrica]|uniref:Uncharacterized protein n=1 Tax=Lucifera butyrica TaxID=1351585 RepID=A0A498RAJ2_9FIRM|nr:hypothetical protein [Lucifera butyrica]VBB08199.1 Hypothetical protein LUCI_3468 [Lucifera butyrica]